ncbi:Uncharacterised protein [Mycobacterium tuberculosis]|nr:Uncharacterised protein [Mycobacterium tuberculosis]CKU63022.1 Uncharacterised protein [Mycobacterium tuberculosis]CNZ64193.1 Uncharacterised protein [Mycobacterium tuberculosis]COX51128.1 Uncharacterised protein [Mycobacterium tuberculosis]
MLAGLAEQGIKIGRRHCCPGGGTLGFRVRVRTFARRLFNLGRGVSAELSATRAGIDLDPNLAVPAAN